MKSFGVVRARSKRTAVRGKRRGGVRSWFLPFHCFLGLFYPHYWVVLDTTNLTSKLPKYVDNSVEILCSSKGPSVQDLWTIWTMVDHLYRFFWGLNDLQVTEKTTDVIIIRRITILLMIFAIIKTVGKIWATEGSGCEVLSAHQPAHQQPLPNIQLKIQIQIKIWISNTKKWKTKSLIGTQIQTNLPKNCPYQMQWSYRYSWKCKNN